MCKAESGSGIYWDLPKPRCNSTGGQTFIPYFLFVYEGQLFWTSTIRWFSSVNGRNQVSPTRENQRLEPKNHRCDKEKTSSNQGVLYLPRSCNKFMISSLQRKKDGAAVTLPKRSLFWSPSWSRWPWWHWLAKCWDGLVEAILVKSGMVFHSDKTGATWINLAFGP